MERSHAVVNGLTRSLSRSEDDVDRQDFKLLIDPAIKKGHAKIFRYNGVFPGQPPVIPRDPRSRRTRIWTLNKADLPVPNFKVDDCYVGIPPQREVLFSALNDNVDKKFLQQMCERYGRIDAIKIYFDPQTKKHTGKGRVTFSTTTAAKMAVAKLNHTSVMGNIIKAQIEPNSKVLEAHGMSQRGSEHPPPRRSSGHESGTIASTVLPPAGVSRSLGHLSTPPPSVISQSPSTDSSVSSPSLLLMRSCAASVRLPADIWSTSFSNSWDRTTASANKVSQAGTAFLSPQSISSGQSGFEPVSPPHSFQRSEEPPPPPPPSSKPPPPPVDRGSSKDPPPPPPDEKLLPSSSYMKFEDISPDPVFSPEDEGKIPQSTSLSKEKTNDKAVSKVCSRDSVHNLSPPSKVHSPRSDRSEGHKNWEKKKLHEREERNRDKYRDYHKYNRTDDRDRKYDKHGDNRYKRENYFDKKDDKRDYYRRNDHDRNWNSGHWDRDDYKHRKDKYSTSPRRGEERRKSDGKESRSRDPRLRERDSESSEGRDFHSKDPRDRDERDGRDNRCRDPRLRGRNVENSDANSRDKKAKEWCGDSETAESRDSMSKDSSCRDNESKSLSARNMSGKDFGAKVGENDNSKLKARDPRLQEKVNGNDSIYHLERGKSLDSKDNVNKQRENCESEDRGSEWTSKVASFDEEQCTSVENQSDSQLQNLTSTEVTTAETVSTFAASTPSAEIRPLNKYSEEAYTIGVDACSDEEEPLPPGYERDVAHEVQLEITRNKIKAAQNAVKKRKLSETVQEEKQDGGSKAKKIQIVLKSAQFNSTETAYGCLSSSDTLVKGEECEEVQGGWRCVSLVSTDKSTPEVAADVAISSSEADDSTVALVNLPLTEDISPCNSPALEETVQVECNDNSESSKPPNEPLTNDLYSDIEANDDDNDVGNGVDVDDDDAMSLSSISSNEDTLEVNKPDETPMLKPKPITVPPPGVVFHPYPPPLFNPRLPPPLLFNPMVPPPPLGPVRVPPPPIPSVPSVPPPTIRPPTLPPPSIPPPSVPPPSVPPIPVPPGPIPPPVLGGPPGFFDKRVPPPFPGGSYPNSAGFGYQKVEQKKPWRSRIIDEVYRVVYSELDMVLTRDIFKKLVEASAFKALESWWDNQTKPKTSPATATTSSRNLPMYQHHPPATVGLPSNSGNVASTIGPSPFERPSSMVLGLRASLPKLPSFKVKRPPEPPKSETVDSLVRKRSNTESPVMHEQEVKKRCVDDGEADSEMDTDLESSWDRRPRTVSRVEEEERSQSPWQHLDDSMDVAPPATRVRTTEADERRPSTGSSLYHTLYSSGSSSTESESEESASDEEEEEEEEESEEESDESDSDEESESDSEQEEKRHEEQKVDVVMDVDEHIEENQEEAQARVEEKQAIKQQSSSESSTSLPSPSWKNEVALPSVKQEPDRTVETRTLPNLTSSQVERTAPTEQFRSFHIANIVPDLFKNQENTSDTTLGRDSNKTLDKDQIDRTEREPESNETIIKTEPVLEDITAENLTAESETDANNLSSLQDTNTTTTLEQSLEIPEVKTPICAPEFGLQDKQASKPPNLQLSVDAKPDLTDELDINQSNGMFDERMPLLSPDKPLAVSLIELDHSYGLVIPQEPPPPQEEPEVFEPPLPSDKRLTESPVLDVVSVDSVAPMLPLPDLSPPKPQFPVRSFEADDELVLEFHRLGVDAEDAYYLKVGFEQLQQVGSESVLDAHWSNHPPTAQPTLTKRRKQKAEHGVRVHVTGCARAEGFYKIDINEKAKYLQSQRRQLQCQANVNKEEQKTDGNKAKQQSREHRAIQRRLQSAVFNEEFGDLLKFNQLMVRKKQLRFAKSGIHDWGLFALESIAADEMVTEYVGEVIRQPMADIRERRYEESGIGSSYLFRVDQDTIIDATTKGNLARFINHCCDPNCYAKIVTLENAKKIVIYSKRDIAVNDEITYDYKFPIEDEKIPCLCGVAQCRGTLN